eukprot:1143728-Pelagomonas_calceolata.AAC.2
MPAVCTERVHQAATQPGGGQADVVEPAGENCRSALQKQLAWKYHWFCRGIRHLLWLRLQGLLMAAVGSRADPRHILCLLFIQEKEITAFLNNLEIVLHYFVPLARPGPQFLRRQAAGKAADLGSQLLASSGGFEERRYASLCAGQCWSARPSSAPGTTPVETGCIGMLLCAPLLDLGPGNDPGDRSNLHLRMILAHQFNGALRAVRVKRKASALCWCDEEQDLQPYPLCIVELFVPGAWPAASCLRRMGEYEWHGQHAWSWLPLSNHHAEYMQACTSWHALVLSC